MTDAPDPGLTDLIAAHWRSLDLLKMKYICSCGDWEYRDDDRERACASWCGHVALVVEQHTNRRIAELEARIANAQSLCHDTGRYNAARQKYWNIRVFACDVLAALKGRAALEGEQQ